MSFTNREFASPSPVLTLPPQPSHQTPLNLPSFAPQQARPTFVAAMDPPASSATMQRAAMCAGRKRSRDEAAVNLEPDVAAPSPAPESETEWTYGPGMVLIKPGSGYVAEASSQSGTWLEEKEDAVKLNAARQLEAQSLDLRSHKSQRVDQTPFDEASFRDEFPGASGSTMKAPIVDDFTVHLGIGWRKLSEEDHIQAAARGWARFIENHFPLTNVSIRLESKGLQSFLVEACEGFFLFAEDLRRGRLVSQTVDGVLRNLQSVPPTFDSTDELLATESPRAATHHQESIVADGGMEVD